MATLEIPTPGLPWTRFRVELDGELFGLEIRWNGTAGAFFCDLFDADDNPLERGAKMVSGTPLFFQQCGRVGFPKGLLMVADTDPSQTDPTPETFGDRVRLYYREAT